MAAKKDTVRSRRKWKSLLKWATTQISHKAFAEKSFITLYVVRAVLILCIVRAV